MLNYSKASWAGTANVSGTGPILLANVMCRGFEKSLEYCGSSGWGQHICRHYEDAGVKCEYVTKGEVSFAKINIKLSTGITLT
jgi:deleted-in-malignant-brain-tumors protein 1